MIEEESHVRDHSIKLVLFPNGNRIKIIAVIYWHMCQASVEHFNPQPCKGASYF